MGWISYLADSDKGVHAIVAQIIALLLYTNDWYLYSSKADRAWRVLSLDYLLINTVA